jgi:hypothetical protein
LPSASAPRKALLDKRIQSLNYAIEETNLTLTLLRQLAKLRRPPPATDAEAEDSKGYNRKRIDPAWRQRQIRYQLDLRRRCRERQQLLEDELAGLLQAAPSESRDARIQHLTAQIEAMKGFVEVDKEYKSVRERLRLARLARGELSADGKDAGEADEKFKKAELEFRAIRLRRAELQVRERLRGQLEETPWAHAPGSVDEAQLREFQRKLAEGVVDDQQLAAIEQALDAVVPTDAYASIERTRAGSSSGPTWQERLQVIYQEQLDLRAQWRARLQERLDSAGK